MILCEDERKRVDGFGTYNAAAGTGGLSHLQDKVERIWVCQCWHKEEDDGVGASEGEELHLVMD